MSEIEKDKVTGTDTTGHQWDGVKELNTPLPRWWLLTFYVCIIWGILYSIAYPAWPIVAGATKGLLGYSSRGQLADELASVKTARAKYVDQIAKLPVGDILKNKDLTEFATAAGRSAFSVNCVQCHGSGAAGGVGFPNLNDDDWLWGGKIDQIYQTISHGIRFDGDDDTRQSDMPRFLADGILTKPQINDVAEYVLSLSGKSTDKAAADKGAALFAENCVACHGEKGVGNQDLGAPRLSDPIWLYGGDKATIMQTISYARRGVMPAWSHRLDAAVVKELAVYVHSLGGGL